MVGERDYAGEREKKKNQSEFQFQGGTQGLVKNAPRRPNNKPRIPVDKGYYVLGRATQEARQLAAAHSRPKQPESEQLPPQYEQEQTQEVAIAIEGTLVLVIGAVVLVAYGSTLFLQVQDENGETQTLNEYAARPVADLLEQVTSDVANYYQTGGKGKLAEIRSGASRALNKILVRKEPEPQVYTSPNGEQGTIEHTGHAPPEVETGTPGTDTGQQVETGRHTGHGQQEQQTAEDYVLESRRRDVRGHDDEGGHTDDRHIGKSESWLRNRQRSENKKTVSTFNDYQTANLVQARFIKKHRGEIEAWLKSRSKRNFAEDITFDKQIGTVIKGKAKAKPTNKAKVVLKKDNSELGYRVQTSYPVP